jgi:hypothetical protein
MATELSGPPPRPTRVRLIDQAGAQREALIDALLPLAGELEVVEDPAATGNEPNLVVANYDALAANDRENLLVQYGAVRERPPLLLLSEGNCQADFAPLFGARRLTNLLARNGEVNPRDLAVTVAKLLGGDLFGLSRYFAAGAEVLAARLTRSSERDQVLAQVTEHARQAAVPPRLVAHLCTAADELMTNALYNGPRDEHGGSRFSHLSRSSEVALSAGEHIEIALCADDRRVGIAVADPFGSLAPEMLLDHLGRCFRGGPGVIENKPGGAGLGLFYIFDAVSQLVANLQAGHRTELIGLIDVRGRYRDFAASHKGFNIFTG